MRRPFVCQLFLMIAVIIPAQDLALPHPDIVGRWKVVESWDIELDGQARIARTEALPGYDTLWIFANNQELQVIDPLHMVDPVRGTYRYHWRWLNDADFDVIPGSRDLYLRCHVVGFSPSRLALVSNAVSLLSAGDRTGASSSLLVLRILERLPQSAPR